jgi:hypothetical protein
MLKNSTHDEQTPAFSLMLGYCPTGLNVVPWNVFAFVIGIILWFTNSVMWKNRPIMIVQAGAFIAIVQDI